MSSDGKREEESAQSEELLGLWDCLVEMRSTRSSQTATV